MSSRRYDEFGRLKKQFRSGMSEADRKAREEAALARLRGEYNPAPSAGVSLPNCGVHTRVIHARTLARSCLMLAVVVMSCTAHALCPVCVLRFPCAQERGSGGGDDRGGRGGDDRGGRGEDRGKERRSRSRSRSRERRDRDRDRDGRDSRGGGGRDHRDSRGSDRDRDRRY